jgi:hypothetical protein
LPLWAVVFPPVDWAFPPSEMASELPFPIWMFPVFAAPPLPPVADPLPPVAEGSPWVTVEALLWPCSGACTGGVEAAADPAVTANAALAAIATNMRFIVISFTRVEMSAGKAGSRQKP